MNKDWNKFPKVLVLNLIINGLPSKHDMVILAVSELYVLNLIINGLPSKQKKYKT